MLMHATHVAEAHKKVSFSFPAHSLSFPSPWQNPPLQIKAKVIGKGDVDAELDFFRNIRIICND